MSTGFPHGQHSGAMMVCGSALIAVRRGGTPMSAVLRHHPTLTTEPSTVSALNISSALFSVSSSFRHVSQ
jgi:hypothetical protein